MPTGKVTQDVLSLRWTLPGGTTVELSAWAGPVVSRDGRNKTLRRSWIFAIADVSTRIILDAGVLDGPHEMFPVVLDGGRAFNWPPSPIAHEHERV